MGEDYSMLMKNIKTSDDSPLMKKVKKIEKSV